MPLTKQDLKDIKDTVVEAVDPYFTVIQDDFNGVESNFKVVNERFDKMEDRLERIEKLMLADHKQRIEKLERERETISPRLSTFLVAQF